MATMWPQDIPKEIAEEPFRSAEVRVFRKLEAELPDPYVVFYAKPWFGYDPKGNEIDGECDFLIAHPSKGFLALEVKGGGIMYDPRTDSWSSTNRHGDAFDIKDPVRQAMISKKQILHKLNAYNNHNKKRYLARHGVIFPDCVVGPEDLSAGAPRRMVCDFDEFERGLEAWIAGRFENASEKSQGETQLGHHGIEILHDIFAKPIHLNVPLRKTLAEDEQSLDLLTREQFQMLRYIEAIPRVTIPGGAGTGKTVLAVQELVNCSEKGMRVLYTCYNDGLVAKIRDRLKGRCPADVDILNFHELCRKLCMDAKIDVPREPRNKSEKLLYYEETLPKLLERAAENIVRYYDAIIVDEGQDFRANWWIPLLKTLNPSQDARLRVFYDDNQKLYDSASLEPVRSETFPVSLSRNLRNTKRIFELITRHYEGPPMTSTAPEGLDVNWVETGSEKSIVDTVLDDLRVMLFEESIAPQDVTILVHSGEEAKKFRRACEDSGIATQACDDNTTDAVTVDSVRRFKGLESLCLILALTAESVQDREWLYVGISRAKTFLSIVGTRDILDKVYKPS